MTTSILNDCLQLRNEPLSALRKYFETIAVTVFDAIFNSGAPELEIKQDILYLLCAFSEDSPMVVLRQDITEGKKNICEYLDIPEFRREHLFNLTDRELRKAATQYLQDFAGPVFKSYKFLQIQVADIEMDITNRAFVIRSTEVGKDGAPDVITEKQDIKEHSKAVTEYARLCKQLDSIERQMRQTHSLQMQGLEDMKKFQRDGKSSGKIKGVRTGNVEHAIN